MQIDSTSSFSIFLIFGFSVLGISAQAPTEPVVHCQSTQTSFELSELQVDGLKSSPLDKELFSDNVGWADCGFENQSPPNIHAGDKELFRVTQKAAGGHCFLSMVAR